MVTMARNEIVAFQSHRNKLLITLLCMIDRTFLVSSFATGFSPSRRSDSAARFMASNTEIKEAEGADENEISSLQFVASTCLRTDSAPLPALSSQLVDFFRVSEYRNLLLGVNDDEDNIPSVETLQQPSPDLWNRWTNESITTGSPAPRPDVDELLLVKSSGMPFPLGLTMFVESIVGVSLVVPDNSLPAYQFTLVKDTVRAEGPRPLVWTYNKIMKASSQNGAQATHSFSTVQAAPSPDKPGEIVFQSDADIEVNIYFPRMLLKLLPMSREKSNAMGSESTQKTFEVKGEASLKNFEKTYREWLEQK